MGRRRRTCAQCGEQWRPEAAWCGRCGGALRSPSAEPRRHLPSWVRALTAAGIGVLLLVGVVGLVREVAPAGRDASAAVPLPTLDPSLPVMRDPTVPRCETGGASTSCVVWSEPAGTGVEPVAALGSVVTVEADGLVARRVEDGSVLWARGSPSPVIWLHSGARDAGWLLAVDEDRRLAVVDATSGLEALGVAEGNPVFPGVVDDRIAVAGATSTVVHDLRHGGATTVPHAGSRVAVRLVPGAVVTWDDETLRIGVSPDDERPVIVDLDDRAPVADAVGDGRLVVVTHGDGSLTAVDRATRSVRWEHRFTGVGSTPLVAVGHDVTVVRRTLDADEIVFLSRSDGSGSVTTPMTDVIGLHDLAGPRVLVVSRASTSSIALQTLSGPNHVRLVVPGGDPDVRVDGDVVMVGGATGATLLDLATGTELLRFGEGPTTAVSLDPPVVRDGDVVHRLTTGGER